MFSRVLNTGEASSKGLCIREIYVTITILDHHHSACSCSEYRRKQYTIQSTVKPVNCNAVKHYHVHDVPTALEKKDLFWAYSKLFLFHRFH
jgi:hypothetical protein